MSEPLTLENPTIAKPKRIQVSSSTFLFTISMSLLSFTFLCLSSKDTTFWFLLSNAIIFFVAADSNASSPSKSKPKSDIYDEYLKIARSRNAYIQHVYRASVSPTFPATISDGDKETEAFEKSASENDDFGGKCSEPEKEIVAAENKKKMPHELEVGNNETEPCSFSPSKPKSHLYIEYSKVDDQEKKEASDVLPSRIYCRSESEKAIVAVESKEKALRRCETVNGGGESDDSDFSAMSNEELNRRVEEFIQRFNRQMRLQGVMQRSECREIF